MLHNLDKTPGLLNLSLTIQDDAKATINTIKLIMNELQIEMITDKSHHCKVTHESEFKCLEKQNTLIVY